MGSEVSQVSQVQQRVREQCGLRIDPAMAEYLLGQLRTGRALPDTLEVIGGHARTGRPLKFGIPLHLLHDAPFTKPAEPADPLP